jgi:pimeloyl-ACP methyl ester carboxylesterase
MWQPFEQALEGSGIQTITFDAPDVWESTNWRRPRRMGALARTVDRLIGALGYETVDVLGVSFGGALAQQLARQSSDRVRRLVLAATAPGMPGLGGVPGRPSAMLALATPRHYYSPAYFRKVAPTLYGGRIRREPELMTEQAHARMTRPPSPRGYAAQLCVSRRFRHVIADRRESPAASSSSARSRIFSGCRRRPAPNLTPTLPRSLGSSSSRAHVPCGV